uniref:Uncharacterized protein n=1 Tax=Cacopsylla melanoneura TaxID=428564 RepID=A0A8D8ZCJ7_9HEMI
MYFPILGRVVISKRCAYFFSQRLAGCGFCSFSYTIIFNPRLNYFCVYSALKFLPILPPLSFSVFLLNFRSRMIRYLLQELSIAYGLDISNTVVLWIHCLSKCGMRDSLIVLLMGQTYHVTTYCKEFILSPIT